MVVYWVFQKDQQIGGDNCVVKIDESKYGKRKYDAGQVIDGQWVFGCICKETGELFMPFSL